MILAFTNQSLVKVLFADLLESIVDVWQDTAGLEGDTDSLMESTVAVMQDTDSLIEGTVAVMQDTDSLMEGTTALTEGTVGLVEDNVFSSPRTGRCLF